MLTYGKHLKHLSGNLRKNMTDAERRLWSRIRNKQIKGCLFYRQKPIGNYIVDFYCYTAQMVIELDGGQHYTEEGLKMDSLRDKYLQDMGLNVLRFSDSDIFWNMEGVLEKISVAIDESLQNPPVSPFKKGG